MEDSTQIRELIKTALTEVLEERQDLLKSAVEDALEDAGLARAIFEGQQSELVPREEIMNLLEGRT